MSKKQFRLATTNRQEEAAVLTDWPARRHWSQVSPASLKHNLHQLLLPLFLLLPLLLLHHHLPIFLLLHILLICPLLPNLLHSFSLQVSSTTSPLSPPPPFLIRSLLLRIRWQPLMPKP